MGNSGFIALRTRALLCSAASLELQRAELQTCKHKKRLRRPETEEQFNFRTHAHGWTFQKLDQKVKRNSSATGTVADLWSESGRHGQKMLQLPDGITPS